MLCYCGMCTSVCTSVGLSRNATGNIWLNREAPILAHVNKNKFEFQFPMKSSTSLSFVFKVKYSKIHCFAITTKSICVILCTHLRRRKGLLNFSQILNVPDHTSSSFFKIKVFVLHLSLQQFYTDRSTLISRKLLNLSKFCFTGQFRAPCSHDRTRRRPLVTIKIFPVPFFPAQGRRHCFH